MAEIKGLTIGTRVLDQEQMKNILPGYENIYKQMQEMRNYAKQQREEMNKEASKYKKSTAAKEIKLTNNVFAILGSRGAGKSSVLETLKRNIEMNQHLLGDNQQKLVESKNEVDIILPIILPVIFPEKMGNRSDMIGWLLGMFEQIVQQIGELSVKQSKKMREESSFIDCRERSNYSEVYKKYRAALKQYRYTKEDYAEILKENFSGLQEYVDKTKAILDPENKLRDCFFELIDEMVRVKGVQDSKEPMVFIFLDDIDLSKTHCQELLQLIIRYLSHPNIVVFISGDYQIFENEQFMSYMRDSQLMDLIVNPTPYNRIGQRLLQENALLAKDTLKKVLPPAYRYRLSTLSTKEKLKFHYSNQTLKELLEEKFKNVGRKEGEAEQSLKVINAYGMILDDMPRGIMNVYYALNSMQSNIALTRQSTYGSQEEKIGSGEKAYSDEFRILLDTIICSSAILSQYEDEIKTCIQIDDKFARSFLNPERLKKQIEAAQQKYNYGYDSEGKDESYQKLNEGIDKNNEIHQMIVVFILAHFIESIVQLVNPERKVHGKEQIWELVDQTSQVKDKFKLYPHIKELHIILDLYEAMLSNDALNIMPTMDEIYLKDFSVKFYFEHLEQISELSKENIGKHIAGIMMQDGEWVQEKFKIIYYHRNLLCMVFNKAIYVVEDKLKIEQAEDIKKINEKFNMDVYNTINTLSVPYEPGKKIQETLKENISVYQSKLKTLIKESITEGEAQTFNLEGEEQREDNDLIVRLDEALKNYFASLEIEEKRKALNEDNFNKVCQAILIEAIHQSENLELEYYAYFEEWHQALAGTPVYDNWCSKQEKSPLTLILENQKYV